MVISVPATRFPESAKNVNDEWGPANAIVPAKLDWWLVVPDMPPPLARQCSDGSAAGACHDEMRAWPTEKLLPSEPLEAWMRASRLEVCAVKVVTTGVVVPIQ